MIPIRVVAIPTEIADAVRRTHKDPHYGHPAHTAVAGEGAPTVSISGLTLMPGGLGANSLFNHHQDTVQFYDDAFWSRGVHSLKFGFALEHFRYNLFGENRPNGQVTFPSLQGFLLNHPSAASFLISSAGKRASRSRWRTPGRTSLSMNWRTVSRISFWWSLSEKSIVSAVRGVHAMLTQLRTAWSAAGCHRVQGRVTPPTGKAGANSRTPWRWAPGRESTA